MRLRASKPCLWHLLSDCSDVYLHEPDVLISRLVKIVAHMSADVYGSMMRKDDGLLS